MMSLFFGISLDNVCFPLGLSWFSHEIEWPIKASHVYYSQQLIVCTWDEKIKRIENFKYHMCSKQGVDYNLNFWSCKKARTGISDLIPPVLISYSPYSVSLLFTGFFLIRVIQVIIPEESEPLVSPAHIGMPQFLILDNVLNRISISTQEELPTLHLYFPPTTTTSSFT